MSTTFTPVNTNPGHKNNTAPKTPTKKTNVAMTPKTPTPNTKNRLTPSSPTTNTTSPNNKRTKARTPLPPIPTTLASASASDLLILRLRDESSTPWTAINQAWTDLTGISVGGSTLRARYNTMKKNFVVVDPGDEAKILQAKKDIEGRLETEKWRLIAEEVGKAGGGTYPGECLRKYVREMEKGMKGGAAVATAAANGGDQGEEDVDDDDDVKMEAEED
ncbi:hypothetical protein AtubIFM55763_006200 [Aspergillus tubingensis]|uniref:Myb-like domain-containing protein n=2 Tax=Aspergillus subgen. Circumdati TaxID=2720871 RepID=A0A124BWN1_ASPNG|nr:uncharacterized protein AtWU_07929 [Aspergillus tubingensis]GAQ39771.1 hypothetical protein AKAW_04202 [Aspergillus niger]GFN18127.1 hypothetical protein AtWU_07929 [Aspergillus tubingensis]GLA59053.1 hypothetical protein AtubIFM54640_009783 [Aspergillus tubingensis]GLA74946.1 hypothetical protein AtubIFM55763_006200 [Aspergillus tubingensis]GLA89754.1 hypothetical protein AtubIFM56815_004244 [Aspergillus tubingensis]